jgi:hypothetical protein
MSGFGFDPSGALLSSDTRAISAHCLIGRDDPMTLELRTGTTTGPRGAKRAGIEG